MIKRLTAAAMASALIAALSPSAQAQSTVPRKTFDFHETNICDAVRLVSAEYNVRLVCEGSVPATKITNRFVNVTFYQTLELLTHGYGLEARASGIGSETIYYIGSSESVNRRAAVIKRYAMRNLKVDENLQKQIADNLPVGTGVVVVPASNRIIISGPQSVIARADALMSELDQPLSADGGGLQQSTAIPLFHAKASRIEGEIAKAFPNTALFADDVENAIVASGSPDFIAQVKQMIAALDLRTPQVVFEVKVVDYTPVNDSQDVGVQWGGIDVTGAASTATGSTVTTFARPTLTVNARLSALVSTGNANILQKPVLRAMNNQTSTFNVGERYPIILQNAITGVPTERDEQIGVILTVTPIIGKGVITGQFRVEDSSIAGFNGTYPIVKQNVYEGPVQIHDGETVVLANLMADTSTDSIDKIKGLGDIPVLGAFFRHRSYNHVKNEIVFVITPHIEYVDEASAPRTSQAAPVAIPGAND